MWNFVTYINYKSSFLFATCSNATELLHPDPFSCCFTYLPERQTWDTQRQTHQDSSSAGPGLKCQSQETGTPSGSHTGMAGTPGSEAIVWHSKVCQGERGIGTGGTMSQAPWPECRWARRHLTLLLNIQRCSEKPSLYCGKKTNPLCHTFILLHKHKVTMQKFLFNSIRLWVRTALNFQVFCN